MIDDPTSSINYIRTTFYSNPQSDDIAIKSACGLIQLEHPCHDAQEFVLTACYRHSNNNNFSIPWPIRHNV